MLKRFFEMHSEIKVLMVEKGKEVPELRSDIAWVKDLAFMVDITE